MTTIRVIHSSGRFDAPVADVVEYLAALVEHYQPDLITTTESQQRGIVRAVRKGLGREWAVARHREYIVAWRRTVFANRPHRNVARRAVAQLSRIPGLPGWRNLFVGSHRLTLRSCGAPVLVEAAHTPSGVESGDRWRTDAHGPTRQVLAYWAGAEAWGRRIERRHRRHPELVQVLAMDSNLDQHRKVWSRYLTRTLHAASVWRHHQTPLGTHAGRRLIDTIHVVGASVVDADVCATAKPKSLDHTAIVCDLYVKENR